MAEVKAEAKKVIVGAGAFPTIGGAQAQAMKKKVEAAGLKDFTIKQREEYLYVQTEAKDEAEAKKIIQEGKEKGITLVILE